MFQFLTELEPLILHEEAEYLKQLTCQISYSFIECESALETFRNYLAIKIHSGM